jgi:DNA-binding beta-propeller fold protein YncE
MNFTAKQWLMPLLTGAILSLVVYSCKHERPGNNLSSGSGYPDEVASIIVNRCATSGCHNSASYTNAAGLRLDTWEKLFDGSSHGAVIIPYDTGNSSLLYYINTDPSLGNVAVPRMPYVTGDPMHDAPLTRQEYMTIKNWVLAGAPDRNGNIPFASNADTRQKVYLTQQGCDLLSVIDAERKVIMRNIRLGKDASIETPHCVRVSKDGRYAYVSFTNGLYVQKIDTRTDQVVGEVKLSEPFESAQWNVLHISDDGSKFIVSDLARGNLKIVNTADMTIVTDFGPGTFAHPHGIESNTAFDTFYVTGQFGNTVYKVTTTGSPKSISVDGEPANNSESGPNLHEIMMTPDHSKYFLTCENTNEVRVMDAYGDTLIHNFSGLPAKPQELAISKVQPYIFVTCMEDAATPVANARGAVVVINYTTMQIVKVLYGDFYQPHAVTVDDDRQVLYVASANILTTGPAPHHVSECAGRNGWYSIYDINTWAPVRRIRYETSVAPYSADIRFKK